MRIYEFTLSHRGTNDKVKFIFPNYQDACRYGHKLDAYSSLLNGYTIRRMVVTKTGGAFHCDKVLRHVRWH